MSITTFADLISKPATHKIALAEITVGEQVTATWTLHAGNVYKITYGSDVITLPGNGMQQVLQEEVIDFKAYNGSSFASYVIQTSVSQVSALNYSWWHDFANTTLYVNFGGLNPNTDVSLIPAMLYFVVRIATEGVSFLLYSAQVWGTLQWSQFLWENTAPADRYYDPYLQSIPSISQSTKQLLGGYATTSVSNIVINNKSGFFDSFLQNYVWENQKVTVKFGGENLPYSEYATVFQGTIIEKTWTRDAITLQVRSWQDRLLDLIPRNIFTVAAYPNMNPQMVGSVRPIAYGTFTSRTAPLVTAIDESTYIASDAVKFMIADHALYSIDNVYVSYDGGATWISCTNDGATPPIAANKYTGDAANGVVIVRFNAASYSVANNNRPLVKVAFKGKKNADTTQMVKTADVVQDLLCTYGLFSATGDLVTTEFTASKTNSDAVIQVYINSATRISDVLDLICKSDFAFLFVNNAGKFVYRVWIADRSGSSIALDDTDLIDIQVNFLKDDQYTSVRIAYAQALTGSSALFGGPNQDYLYSLLTDTIAVNKYGVTSTLVINTCLQTSAVAASLAARSLMIHKLPVATISGIVKWQLGAANIGDKISITTSRAPYTSGAYASFLAEITGLKKDFASGTIHFEAKALDALASGLNSGFWTSDAYSNWNVVPSEKATAGYWCDDNGFASTSDPTSFNVSTWW